MKDIVILKESIKEDKLQENSPNLAFVFYMMIGIIGLFVFLFIGCFVSSKVVRILLNIFAVLFLLVCCVVIPVKNNNEKNISKSIGFIKRNNVLYAIKLMYDAPGMIYAPAGTTIQAATTGHNIKAASKVQQAEKEIRERRTHEDSYILALDDILKHLESDPNAYKRSKTSKLDEILDPFCTLETKNGVYGFLILNNAKIVEENENILRISFTNPNQEPCFARFQNVYPGLSAMVKEMEG